MTDIVNSSPPLNDSTASRQASLSTPIPFGRLLAVEGRKLFDTRTGQVVTALLAVITIGSVVARAFIVGPELQTLIFTTAIGFSTLLPVLGILTVTGEWSHHTAVTTFALEPRRARVLLAKCLPPMITALAASLLAILVALPVTAIMAKAQGVPADLTVDVGTVAFWFLNNVITVLVGLALGLALLNAPAAIVISLTMTIALNSLGRFGAVGAAVSRWIDLSGTTMTLAGDHSTVVDVARLATAFAFWVILPMTIGFIRVLRKEVS